MTEEFKGMVDFQNMLSKLSLKQVLALQHVLSQLALGLVLKDEPKSEVIKPVKKLII